ncbi:hypothetical protein BH11PSE3_BH11PSE3_09100 [soil metagenome]
MMSRKSLGVAASLVLGALSLTAIAAPANAAWWGNGQYQPDNRWDNNNRNNNRNNDNNNNNNNYNNRYDGYHYREPPVVYSTPYNYGYQPPPVIYANTPGFTIRIQ